MGMIERRLGADAHEFARADFDHRDTGVVMEVRNDVLGHDFALDFDLYVAAHHTGLSACFIVTGFQQLFKSHRSGTPGIEGVAPQPQRQADSRQEHG